ncbi:MAG: hypothetical protein M1825_001691 [Sarcosagium campestre]|nr:MAG: hypothetical protein M1825_001691 [Sarcosagium campestre]
MEPLSTGQQRRRSSASLSSRNSGRQDDSRNSPIATPKRRRSESPIGEDEDEDDDKAPLRGRSRVSGDSSQSNSDDVEMEDLPSEAEGLEDDEESGLSGKDRQRRWRRKRRNARLDTRIAGDSEVSRDIKAEADHAVLKKSMVNALLIGLWYIFSLSISIYNKWMFGPTHLNFNFPLFTTCMHMIVQFTLSSLVLYFVPRFRPRHDSIINPRNIPQSPTPASERAREATQSGKPLMSRMFYLTRIGPCGTATGLDIGLGNMSLKSISLTFFTMCKSSALAFVLLFAFLFRLETPSVKLVLIILTMTIGVIMMVAGEVAFDALGFILIISSAFFSGFRWALTQILLLRNPATSNPFSSIFFLAPIMFASLLVIAIPVEGFFALCARIGELKENHGVLLSMGILLFPGTMAFLMTSSEFALLQRTSVVTLSICGIFKEVVTISAAGIVFHDPLTPINVSGLLVTIASIAAYNYIKIRKMRRDARHDAVANPSTPRDGYVPVIVAPGGDDDHDHGRSTGPNGPVLGGSERRMRSSSSSRHASPITAASSSLVTRAINLIPTSIIKADRRDSPSRLSAAKRYRQEDARETR